MISSRVAAIRGRGASCVSERPSACGGGDGRFEQQICRCLVTCGGTYTVGMYSPGKAFVV